MPKAYTHDAVLEMVQRYRDKHCGGSLRKCAKEFEISATMLSLVLRGHTPVSQKIAQYFGLEVQRLYVVKEDE